MSWKRKDHYFHKAKQENYRARSIYKLKEIDQKYCLIKKGDRVLELGCVPGSWSQYALSRVGAAGKVVGTDRNRLIALGKENFTFIQGDIREKKTQGSLALDSPYHCVLSDMAPDTSGTKFVDQARSLELCRLAAEIATCFLKPGGDFLCKLFCGDDSGDFVADLRKSFQDVSIIRPKATRKESGEIYILSRGFKG